MGNGGVDSEKSLKGDFVMTCGGDIWLDGRVFFPWKLKEVVLWCRNIRKNNISEGNLW